MKRRKGVRRQRGKEERNKGRKKKRKRRKGRRDERRKGSKDQRLKGGRQIINGRNGESVGKEKSKEARMKGGKKERRKEEENLERLSQARWWEPARRNKKSSRKAKVVNHGLTRTTGFLLLAP